MKNPTCPICGSSLEQDAEADMADGRGRSAAYGEATLTHLRTVHPDFWQWEQSKRRLGIVLGAIAATVTGAVLITVFNIILHVNTSSSGRGFAAICFVAFVVPLALINRRGAEHFKDQWQSQGKLPTPTPRMDTRPLQNPVPADDSLIVGLTTNLNKEFDIVDVPVTQVAWKSSIPQGQGIAMIPSDIPILKDNTMYLAENMQGQLSVDEWKPLIASALIYHSKLGARKITWLLSILVPVIAGYSASWFLLPPLYPTTTRCANGQCAVNNFGWDILIIGGVILPVALLVGFAITWKRFRFVADQQTSVAFGKDRLVASLQRVREVAPSDSSMAQKRIDKLTRT